MFFYVLIIESAISKRVLNGKYFNFADNNDKIKENRTKNKDF